MMSKIFLSTQDIAKHKRTAVSIIYSDFEKNKPLDKKLTTGSMT